MDIYRAAKRTESAYRPPSFVPATESATRAAGVTFALPFQDIPAQYIKGLEMQSGEFF